MLPFLVLLRFCTLFDICIVMPGLLDCTLNAKDGSKL